MIGRTNAVSGSGGNEWFDFTYTGDYTETYVDRVRTITLTSSGTFSVINGSANASVYILAGGGGGGSIYSPRTCCGGGGGGNDTYGVMLTMGLDYDVVIGKGGKAGTTGTAPVAGGDGGSTSAFGYTVTGGTGAGGTSQILGVGGTPNGENGEMVEKANAQGGAPNGGACNYAGTTQPQPGGDGKVVITITV